MSTDEQRPTNVRWIVFGLGCGTSWFLYLHRYTFALIKPKLQEEWGLSNTELGVLDSAFSIFYSALQFPSGIAADVLGAHFFLGGIILFWSIALGLHAFAPGVTSLWYARAAFGAGQAGAFASVNRVARTWIPQSTRTTAQGWMGVFSGRIGAASANVLFATVLIGFVGLNWRWAVMVLAICGTIHGIAFLLLFRNSAEMHPWANHAEAELIRAVPQQRSLATDVAACPVCGAVIQPTDANCQACGEQFDRPDSDQRSMTLREMLSRMSPRSILNLFSVTLTSTLSTIADNIYSNWIPLFLVTTHGLKFKEMGIYSALPLIGGACGGAFGGFLNDRLMGRFENRRWVRSLVGFGGKGLAGVLIVAALMTSYHNPYRFCVLLFFVKFFADISLATRWGAVSDIGGNATATVFGFNNALASIGAIAAPLMYGYVADHYPWETVFIIGGVMYGLCALSWLLIDCTIPLIRGED